MLQISSQYDSVPTGKLGIITLESCKPLGEKINNYYKINDCIGINFSSQNNENILYSEEAVVIKNTGKECQLKINIIFLEDNYDGIELSNTTNISINIF